MQGTTSAGGWVYLGRTEEELGLYCLTAHGHGSITGLDDERTCHGHRWQGARSVVSKTPSAGLESNQLELASYQAHLSQS